MDLRYNFNMAPWQSIITGHEVTIQEGCRETLLCRIMGVPELFAHFPVALFPSIGLMKRDKFIGNYTTSVQATASECRGDTAGDPYADARTSRWPTTHHNCASFARS